MTTTEGGRVGDGDDAFEIIYSALADGLKMNAAATAAVDCTAVSRKQLLRMSLEDEENIQRVKCNFQGERRVMCIAKPVSFALLMEKICQYYGSHIIVYYRPLVSLARASSAVKQSMTTEEVDVGLLIDSQESIEEAFRLERLSRPTSSSLHLSLEPASFSQVLPLRDRESPPPGTLPACADGLFIPDDEEPETGSNQSGSRSSLDSSYYSTQSVLSEGSVGGGVILRGGGGERTHGGTYPMSRVGGGHLVSTAAGANARGAAPPNTYPRHSRRPILPTSGSFGSLQLQQKAGISCGSSCSSDWSVISLSGSSSARSANGSTSSISAYSQKSPRRSPGQWRLGRKLGGGVFGQVYLCFDADTGREMAVKQIRVDRSNEDTWKEVRALQSEIQLLKNLQHERVVQYLGSAEDAAAGLLSIFLEYVPAGSVKDQIKEYGPLNERVTSRYTRQVLEGLVYLHQLMIVHRNIKGANILRDYSGNVKLTEFGLSKRLQSIVAPLNQSTASAHINSQSEKALHISSQSDKVLHMQSVVTRYLAPEVLEGKGYGRKADIWSLGCTVVEMMTGSPPWYQQQDSTSLHPHTSPHSHTSPHPAPIYRLPEGTSRQAGDLVSRCFNLKTSSRPMAEELVNHAFCTSTREDL